MSQSHVSGVGAVPAADIAVPEHEREVRFYSQVLTTGANPLWREGELLNNRGMPVIGLGARTEDYADLPLQWMPHIQVADVAASAQRAVALGGSELMHGKADDGTSQWAVLVDPGGAAFGVIPVTPADASAAGSSAAGDEASESAGPVGCIQCVTLTVPDASAAQDFYQQVVGWVSQPIDVAHGSDRYSGYALADKDGNAVAVIRHARGDHAALPDMWLINLPVADLAESLRRVEAEGGKVLRATMGAGDAPAHAVIQDPVGVCMALLASV